MVLNHLLHWMILQVLKYFLATLEFPTERNLAGSFSQALWFLKIILKIIHFVWTRKGVPYPLPKLTISFRDPRQTAGPVGTAATPVMTKIPGFRERIRITNPSFLARKSASRKPTNTPRFFDYEVLMWVVFVKRDGWKYGLVKIGCPCTDLQIQAATSPSPNCIQGRLN